MSDAETDAARMAEKTTPKPIKQCPVCKRGDIWQEAVSRTLYVYDHEEIAKEAIDYLLAEVQTMLAC